MLILNQWRTAREGGQISRLFSHLVFILLPSRCRSRRCSHPALLHLRTAREGGEFRRVSVNANLRITMGVGEEQAGFQRVHRSRLLLIFLLVVVHDDAHILPSCISGLQERANKASGLNCFNSQQDKRVWTLWLTHLMMSNRVTCHSGPTHKHGFLSNIMRLYFGMGLTMRAHADL